jgi:hypothetical protein
VAKLADAPDLGSGGAILGGSSPPFRTNLFIDFLTQHPETTKRMSQTLPEQPQFKLTKTDNYRDSYANSVQVRMSVWDFQLIFGTVAQSSANEVDLQNFQGVYVSPQQAKALWNVLGHNLAQYEQTFGKLALEPLAPETSGPVN